MAWAVAIRTWTVSAAADGPVYAALTLMGGRCGTATVGLQELHMLPCRSTPRSEQPVLGPPGGGRAGAHPVLGCRPSRPGTAPPGSVDRRTCAVRLNWYRALRQRRLPAPPPRPCVRQSRHKDRAGHQRTVPTTFVWGNQDAYLVAPAPSAPASTSPPTIRRGGRDALVSRDASRPPGGGRDRGSWGARRGGAAGAADAHQEGSASPALPQRHDLPPLGRASTRRCGWCRTVTTPSSPPRPGWGKPGSSTPSASR